MQGWDPTRYYTPADVDHYAQVFSDPGSWFHAVEYYRHALPFHAERAPGVFEFWSNPTVAAMWEHPLATHPDRGLFPVFAPEDRHKTYPHPALYLYSPFLCRRLTGHARGRSHHRREPYADSFPTTSRPHRRGALTGTIPKRTLPHQPGPHRALGGAI
jgi:hypothetical protein